MTALAQHPHVSALKENFPLSGVALALELYPNGELFDYISTMGNLETRISRTFAKQLLSAVAQVWLPRFQRLHSPVIRLCFLCTGPRLWHRPPRHQGSS